mgnify:CR=1 FL=1
MYLIEVILKKWFKKKKKPASVLFEFEEREENLFKNCDKHIYMPIDSSSDYLACKNCGHIIKNDKEKNYKKNQSNYDKF